MRFSHSRIDKFRKCPRAWKYSYIEGLREHENQGLLLGKIFHALVDEHYNPSIPKQAMKDNRHAVLGGRVDVHIDFLPNLFELYLGHYEDEIKREKTMHVELELHVDLSVDGKDTIMGKLDEVFEDKGLVGIRDRKTTEGNFKFDIDDVRHNPQMLLYVAMYHEKYDVMVDFIEVDEVRLKELAQVPINMNGKPTVAMNKLGLVTYEAYRAKVEELGLDDDPNYIAVLDQLEKRGHPLFKRTRVYLHEHEIVQENLQDILATYRLIRKSLDDENQGYSRHLSPLCGWCGYKELCRADYYDLDEADREMYTDKFDRKPLT